MEKIPIGKHLVGTNHVNNTYQQCSTFPMYVECGLSSRAEAQTQTKTNKSACSFLATEENIDDDDKE